MKPWRPATAGDNSCWAACKGSLQGQLQLATYLVVFLGFTGASSVGLLIGQRNLLTNDQ